MIFLVGVILIVIIFVFLFGSKDIFSPSKFFLLFLLLYMADIFFTKYSLEMYFIFSLYLLMGGLFVILEKKYVSFPLLCSSHKVLFFNERKALFIIFILSVLPIIAQIYKIAYFGGLSAYLVSMKFRVEMWAGLGYISFIIKQFPIINAIFLILGLRYNLKNPRVWWTLYIIHLLILIMLGLLSGSRGSTLSGILFLMLFYHYLHKRLTVKIIAPIFILLIAFAIFLGQARNAFQYEESLNIRTEQHDYTNTSLFRYGIIPLEIILEKDYTDFKYGSTFITAITNFVPRSIWPEKPSSGGVILTKFAQGDSYRGTSHYSTGLFTESVLNYGYCIGTIFFTMMLLFVIYGTLYLYKKFLFVIKNSDKPLKEVTIIYIYSLLVMIPGNMIYAEFTHTFFTILFKLINFYIIFYSIIPFLKFNKEKPAR